MTPTRYTLIADGPRGVRLHRENLPPLRDTEALVRVTYSLVSPGTERYYVAQLREQGGQLPLGYCAIGEVVAAGAAVHGVRPGERVVAMGWQIATHSDYIVVPRNLLCRADNALPARHAILAAIGATAVHAADRAALGAGDRVLVVGVGLVGTLMAIVAAAAGATVAATDRDRAALERAAAWTPFDLPDPPSVSGGCFDRIFICVDADLTPLFPRLAPLLDQEGRRGSRPKLVNVGRVTGRIDLSPALGNLDIVNVSRCGAGYRNDAYHHGLTDVPVVDGEAHVDRNLARCMAILTQAPAQLTRLAYRAYSVDEALLAYNSAGFFPPGINLITHHSGEASR
ncbi:oxidoreductase [Burkholderia sp. JP2-270]|uniref:oxidoreductase n=1 Tax=Burkholderia sp. JP2-270 TaxID=2217913 RepID=UPI000DA32134|nr:oxidoreductase [Burkholderia sp. JP2-270]AWV02721.1 oxidoreductase [Burkholderia sp. JP2-270]